MVAMRVAEGSRRTRRQRNILGNKWKKLECHNLETGNWKQFPFFCRKFFLDKAAVLWYNRPSVGALADARHLSNNQPLANFFQNSTAFDNYQFFPKLAVSDIFQSLLFLTFSILCKHECSAEKIFYNSYKKVLTF